VEGIAVNIFRIVDYFGDELKLTERIKENMWSSIMYLLVTYDRGVIHIRWKVQERTYEQ